MDKVAALYISFLQTRVQTPVQELLYLFHCLFISNLFWSKNLKQTEDQHRCEICFMEEKVNNENRKFDLFLSKTV